MIEEAARKDGFYGKIAGSRQLDTALSFILTIKNPPSRVLRENSRCLRYGYYGFS